MIERPVEDADEDRASLKSSGKTNGAVKETLGVLQTLRRSIRRASGGKGSKVTPKADADGSESANPQPPPPSPHLSIGSAVTSPLKNMLKKKDEPDSPTQKNKTLPHSSTEPNIGSFLQRGASIRRSLFGTKKEKKQLSEGSVEEKKEENEEEKEEEVQEELEEMYNLPELPHTPLSVMQINKLIEMEVLEEAHLNLLALRQEFQREQEQSGGGSSMELAKKEKDLNILYGDLRNKLGAIVRDSNSLPSRNKALLVHVARIIQEEEKRAEEPGGLPDSWKEAWGRAVDDGVWVKVRGVHLEKREQNVSWLAVHLGLLGKTVVEDLENVRRELKWSYPPSFNVFSSYVNSYHRVVGEHLKTLEQQATELKDLHALLDWILNRYKSERIMGSLCLQADMRDESRDLQLEDGFLKRLKDKYCCRVREDTRLSLNKLIELEYEDFWKDRNNPEREDGVLNSDFHMDVWTKVKGSINASRQMDAQLEPDVTSACLLELIQFPKRFESDLRRHCDALRPQPLWTEYHITYINSFTALQQHMEDYRATCPVQVEEFSKEVKRLNTRLLQDLEDQFKDDVKLFLRRMMTRKWLTNEDDFDKLYDRTELLSQHCALMRPPNVQEFSSRLHYHVVKEYVGQLMKSNYSCKNRKHEKAANKIRQQWRDLQELFKNMESTHEWLFPLGDDLCDIIGQKNTADIKDHLQVLVEGYPDFSRKHLVAVLYFRGLLRGREHQLILQRLSELKKNQAGDKRRLLFDDMQVTVNNDCLSNLPFSCLSFLRPDN